MALANVLAHGRRGRVDRPARRPAAARSAAPGLASAGRGPVGARPPARWHGDDPRRRSACSSSTPSGSIRRSAAFTSEAFYDGRLESRPRPRATSALRGPAPAARRPASRYLASDHVGADSLSRTEALPGRRPSSARSSRADRHGSISHGVEQPIGYADVLVVAPYNAQVGADREPAAAGGAGRHGRQVPGPGGADQHLLDDQQLDPRTRRAAWASSTRGTGSTSRRRARDASPSSSPSPSLLRVRARTPEQMRLANALCQFVELAAEQRSAARTLHRRGDDPTRSPGRPVRLVEDADVLAVAVVPRLLGRGDHRPAQLGVGVRARPRTSRTAGTQSSTRRSPRSPASVGKRGAVVRSWTAKTSYSCGSSHGTPSTSLIAPSSPPLKQSPARRSSTDTFPPASSDPSSPRRAVREVADARATMTTAGIHQKRSQRCHPGRSAAVAGAGTPAACGPRLLVGVGRLGCRASGRSGARHGRLVVVGEAPLADPSLVTAGTVADSGRSRGRRHVRKFRDERLLCRRLDRGRVPHAPHLGRSPRPRSPAGGHEGAGRRPCRSGPRRPCRRPPRRRVRAGGDRRRGSRRISAQRCGRRAVGHRPALDRRCRAPRPALDDARVAPPRAARHPRRAAPGGEPRRRRRSARSRSSSRR